MCLYLVDEAEMCRCGSQKRKNYDQEDAHQQVNNLGDLLKGKCEEKDRGLSVALSSSPTTAIVPAKDKIDAVRAVSCRPLGPGQNELVRVAEADHAEAAPLI